MAFRPLTDHEYRINNGSWVGCTLSNTDDNGDGTYTIKQGLDVDIPIGGLEVRVKAIGINPASNVLVNNTAFVAQELITPVITFDRPDDMVLGGEPQALNVSSSHNTSSVVLTSSNPSIATVTKNIGVWYLTVVASGTINITANQPAETGYNSAIPIVISGIIIADNGLELMPTDIYTERGIPASIIDEAKSTLQEELEDADLWDSVVAIYPFVSTTGDDGYLLNMKNPVDSDAAYRLVPKTTPINVNSIGMVTPANTLIPNSALLPLYSKSAFIYYKKFILENVFLMGTYSGSGNDFGISASVGGFLNSGQTGTTNVNTGLYVMNIRSSSVSNFFQRGLKVYEGAPGSDASNLTIGINGLKTSGNVEYGEAGYVCLAGVLNKGLSDAEQISLNNISENFNNKLLRGYTQSSSIVTFFGDSITRGRDGSPLTLGWAYQLSKLMGWTPAVSGSDGETITTAKPAGTPSFLDRYTTDIKTKTFDDKFIFLSYGTNESILPNGGTPQQYKDGITEVVNYALTKGWMIDDFIIGLGYWIGTLTEDQTEQHEAIMQAALEVCDTLGIDKRFNLYDDMVKNNPSTELHPDNGMHAIIALKWKKYLYSVGEISEWEQ